MSHVMDPLVGRTYKDAGDLEARDIVVERTDRGTIRIRAIVVATSPCSDAGNVHATVSVHGKLLTWCYFRGQKVEHLL